MHTKSTAEAAIVAERAPRGRELDRQLATEQLQAMRQLRESTTELAATLRGGITNSVLGVELAQFDDDGQITRSYGVAMGAVYVANHSTTGDVVVTSAPPGASAPGVGVGAGRVSAGMAATINLAATNLTLYGTAGQYVSLQVFAKAQPPMSGPAVTVPTTATVSGAVTVTGAVTADTELPAAAALSDATANPTAPMVGSAMMRWNGVAWQRESTNLGLTAFASVARTATANSADMSNFNARGAVFVIDCTAIDASPSVVFTVQGKCPVSGVYYDILSSAAIVAAGVTALTVYPGVAETANVKESDILPGTFRVRAVHADTDSITYSVSVSLIL